jgi:hypothetical protein
MPITLDEPRTPGLPVVKRTAVGETFRGAVVRYHDRVVLKDGEPVPKDERDPDGPKKHELVVTCVVLPGTTSPAGLGDTTEVPEAGKLVRLILRGQSYAAWIEQKNGLPGTKHSRAGAIECGDVVTQVTEHGQQYTEKGVPKGGKITDNDEIDALLRKRVTVGIYGPLTLERADDIKWVEAAERAYADTADRVTLDADNAPF